MKLTGVALSLGAVILTAAAPAGPAAKGKAENGLIGVKLYDTGTRVISLYGTPDEIDAVGVGAGTANSGSPFGNGGGGGMPGGPAGFGGPPGRAGGGAPGGMGRPGGKPGFGGASAVNDPFDFADSMLQGGSPGGAPAAGLPPGGPGGPGGMPGGFNQPGGGSPPAGFGGARGGGGAAENATYTRWIYRRNASQYGFVFDKFNRVVQIEAIGITNGKVKTSKGIGFGATFAQIIKTYQAPDGYEISGDNVLVKYLTKSKVAFRLSRLGDKKPQVVTGVVVAAAKG